VKAGLEKRDSFRSHLVYNPMFLRDSPAPAANQFMLQGLWFADAIEGVREGGSHQVENS